MKIIFLCGSLEPGRDGVGDYIRRLAVELIKQEIKVAALALNDRHVNEQVEDYQYIESTTLNVLRIPSVWRQEKRFKRAKEWIEMLDPEWLSLQFVPFSFHPKGLSLTINNQLKWLGKGRRWHIMFHELWVGMSVNSSKKLVLWGWLQQKLIKKLLSKLHPDIIHTQTRLYQAQLTRLGFACEYLPLFSNIPKGESNNDLEVITNLVINEKSISMAIFGTIHPGSPVEDFAKEVPLYAGKNDLEITLLILGRSGPEEKRWIKAWQLKSLRVKVYGEQPPQIISGILEKATFGITTNPFMLVEKSGTVASMREHGLRIICVSKDWMPRGLNVLCEPQNGIMKYKKGSFESFVMKNQNYQWHYRISDTVTQLVMALNINS